MGIGSGLMREVLGGLLPDPSTSSAWRIPAGSDSDNLLSGLGDNEDRVLADLDLLAYTRDPYRCPLELLSDLEREYGIPSSTALTEQDRRAAVAAVKYHRGGVASVAKLQAALDLAGFGAGGYGLIVTANASPPADPSGIVDRSFQLAAHAIGDGSGAVAGNAGAYAAQRGGYYLVNSDSYQLAPVYPQAGLICARAFDGSDTSSPSTRAGYYTAYSLFTSSYTSPPQAYWPLIFFVGGVVTRNGDGSIASIARVSMPMLRRQSLHRLILRIKPLGLWAGMIIQYT